MTDFDFGKLGATGEGPVVNDGMQGSMYWGHPHKPDVFVSRQQDHPACAWRCHFRTENGTLSSAPCDYATAVRFMQWAHPEGAHLYSRLISVFPEYEAVYVKEAAELPEWAKEPEGAQMPAFAVRLLLKHHDPDPLNMWVPVSPLDDSEMWKFLASGELRLLVNDAVATFTAEHLDGW